jgi:hypothetical protein
MESPPETFEISQNLEGRALFSRHFGRERARRPHHGVDVLDW